MKQMEYTMSMSALCSNKESHQKVKVIKKNQMEVLGLPSGPSNKERCRLSTVSATWLVLNMANVATTDGPKANSKE